MTQFKERIYLCYRRGLQVTEICVRDIRDALTQEFGAGSVFLDWASMPAGQTWLDSEERAIVNCAVLVPVIDESWSRGGDSFARQGGVFWELSRATDIGVDVEPVHLEQIHDLGALPQTPELDLLRTRQWRVIRCGRDFRNDIEELANQLRPLLMINEQGAAQLHDIDAEIGPQLNRGLWLEADAALRQRLSRDNLAERLTDRHRRSLDQRKNMIRGLARGASYARRHAWGRAIEALRELSRDFLGGGLLPDNFYSALELARICLDAATRFCSGMLTRDLLNGYRLESDHLDEQCQRDGLGLPFRDQARKFLNLLKRRIDEQEQWIWRPRAAATCQGAQPSSDQDLNWSFDASFDQFTFEETGALFGASPGTPVSPGVLVASRRSDSSAWGTDPAIPVLGSHMRALSLQPFSLNRTPAPWIADLWDLLTPELHIDEAFEYLTFGARFGIYPELQGSLRVPMESWHASQSDRLIRVFSVLASHLQPTGREVLRTGEDVAPNEAVLLKLLDSFEPLETKKLFALSAPIYPALLQPFPSPSETNGSRHLRGTAFPTLGKQLPRKAPKRCRRLIAILLYQGIPVGRYYLEKTLRTVPTDGNRPSVSAVRRIAVFCRVEDARLLREQIDAALPGSGIGLIFVCEFDSPSQLDGAIRSADLCLLLRSSTGKDFRWMPKSWKTALRRVLIEAAAGREVTPVHCMRLRPTPSGVRHVSR